MPSYITNANLAQQISDLLAKWQTRETQMQAWIGGTATGGPFADGTYPLTDVLNNTVYTPSPAALVSGVGVSVSSATAAAAAAAASATAAAGSATAAAGSAATATTQAGIATAQAVLAAGHDTNCASLQALAQTSANAALASQIAAAASATAAAGSASAAATSATNAATSATNAAASATAAAASAVLAATFNPALFAALAGATFTGALAGTSASFSTTLHAGGAATLGSTLIVTSTIGASNFSGTSSGTNTGDQNLAPYALLAGAAFTGAVSIGVSTGVALTISPAAGAQGIDINAASGSSFSAFSLASAQKAFVGVAGAANQLITGAATGDLCVRAVAGAIKFSVDNGASSSFAIASNGAITCAGASSGSTLTVNAAAATTGLFVSNNGAQFSDGATYALNVKSASNGVRIHAGAVGSTALVITDATDTTNLLIIGGTGLATFSGAIGVGVTADSILHVAGPNGCSLRVDYSGFAGDNYYDATRHNFRTTAAGTMLVLTASSAAFAVPITISGVSIKQSGSFTGTLSNMTTTVTGTLKWVSDSQMATLFCSAAITGTSNLSSMSLTGLPAAIQPVTGTSVRCIVNNNGVATTGLATTSAGSGTVVFTFETGGAFTGFTATGTKGLPAGFTITYPIT